MNAHRVETVIRQDRTVVIKNLPFREGEPVEILIFPCSFSSEQGENSSEKDRYPLRGTPIKYLDPTEPVADGDWSVTTLRK